ncbi:Hypothetical predicted protein [Octopus vulgaris]|uniref:Uncharacterized protein n=1 Tax=Octopus vulgaris TaxID=6645 RepID=A0AA36BQH2_OCTVU|nr:Hypothetical predicted protein [Octopus vulgaris]
MSPYEVRVFVAERQVNTLAETAKLADEDALIDGKRQPKNENKNKQFIKSDGVTQKTEAKEEEAAEAGQSRDRAVPEAAFKGCDLSNVVGSVKVAVPSGVLCFSDTGVLSKIKLDPDVGVSDAADAYLVLIPVVDSSSNDAISDSSSTPKSVTLFRDTGADQTLLKHDAFAAVV